MAVYKTPVDGSGTAEDPYRARHENEHTSDPENYNQHLRGDWAYIASTVSIPTFEEYAADDESPVEKVSDASGTEEYPAPTGSSSTEDESDEDDGEEGGE